MKRSFPTIHLDHLRDAVLKHPNPTRWMVATELCKLAGLSKDTALEYTSLALSEGLIRKSGVVIKLPKEKEDE